MTGLWFSPGSSVSSTNKTDHRDIAEILLKVVMSHHKSNPQIKDYKTCISCFSTKYIALRLLFQSADTRNIQTRELIVLAMI